EKLPRVLREFHSAPGGANASGIVMVRRTRGGWLAGLIGFPRAGEGISMHLRVVATGDREIWTRSFGARQLRTCQKQKDGLLLETSGPVSVTMRVWADEKGMRFESVRVRFWFLPIPLRVEAYEWAAGSAWEFQVTIAGVGSYSGRMVPSV